MDGMSETSNPPGLAQLLFEAQAQITKSGGEPRCGVVIEKVVWSRETKLGLAGDSKSHCRLGEVIAPLASIAGLLKPILKLQAATGDDNARTCDDIAAPSKARRAMLP
jgi:hypothetical protein